MKSVEQHKQIIEACKHKDCEKAARLVEENWSNLGELLAQQTD